MKRSLKVLILVFMLFVLSGCTTNCSLEISEDNVFNLEIDVKESMDYVNSFLMEDDDNGDLVKKWLNNTLSTYKKEYTDMNISYSTASDYYVGKATKKFYDIKNLNDLKLLKENFNSVSVVNADKIVDIKIKGLNEELIDQISYNENSIILTVKLPFVVLSSNASSIDKVNNVYTWNLSASKKDILLKYDNSMIYEYKEDDSNPTRDKAIIVLGCVVLGLVVGVIILSIKSKLKK